MKATTIFPSLDHKLIFWKSLGKHFIHLYHLMQGAQISIAHEWQLFDVSRNASVRSPNLDAFKVINASSHGFIVPCFLWAPCIHIVHLERTLMALSIQHLYIFANNHLPKHGFFFTILTLGWTITIDVPFLGIYKIRVVMNLCIPINFFFIFHESTIFISSLFCIFTQLCVFIN